ncbi:SDR family oxidoreductase [Flaviflexus salsibiostraticola]|uniref:SDR family oxidoreductase n=1 Tax=Flaviflexus salsibiostraticola TaxID=1282737 RepID=A0A3S8Z810_9ACTO|nr:SDR family NAD(P)-dependent oxidoreductase [Flaviflexus salsibiostraticola]AZN29630.1 SDR family oxidoreductase [Flaviflexus salsibiostraticola]
MLLADKVAVVTGAGSGFGEATAVLFAKEGASVVVVDIDGAAATAVADAIAADGGTAIAVAADVADPESVKGFIDRAVEEFGQLDILFNNAGIYRPGNVEETSIEDWDRSTDVNLKSVFLGMKYAMPHLKKTKGNVISTASAGGIIGFPDAVSYGATKGGVVSLTRAAAVDYAQHDIRVNCICPGTGETGMTRGLLEDPTIKDAFLAPIPLHRLGQPEDVAKAALFLASDLSGYISGHALPVDDGWTMS